MKKSNFTLSFLTLVILCSFIFSYRINNVDKKEISWDILGYYLYLPATFIYNQPLLDDISWVKKINEEKNLTGTLYQISSNDKGEPMYFFLMGMSFFYLPFFFLAHILSPLLGFPMDGFSPPYQYCLVLGGILYTLIGLIFLRKILNRFFSEKISSLVMVLIVFGTNYIHHLTLDNLATVNVLFMLTTIVIWNTIKWHENYKSKHLIVVGLSIGLMGLVKPSEVIIILLPLLWNVFSSESFKQKLQLLNKNRIPILICVVGCLILALPQMLYWHSKTGKFIYDSYKNPGVGLDFFSPHIFNVLFSYRKGWLLYTPMMFFSLSGFYFIYKNNKLIFYALFCYFLVAFYIISSWTEWWYGAGFSIRPLITTYPVLAICLGYFIQYISQQKLVFKRAVGIVMLFFVFLNQFQWWQIKNWFLDPYRTTKEYYWAVFLDPKPDPDARQYLLVERDFTGHQVFNNKENYDKTELCTWTFEKEKEDNIKKDIDSNSYYCMSPEQEFSKAYEKKFCKLTDKDHVWIEASIDIRFPDNFEGQLPFFVMTMQHSGGCYGYYAPEIKNELKDSKWHTVTWNYLSPEIRSGNDIFQCYIWKPGKQSFDVDNFKLDVYESK